MTKENIKTHIPRATKTTKKLHKTHTHMHRHKHHRINKEFSRKRHTRTVPAPRAKARLPMKVNLPVACLEECTQNKREEKGRN